MNTNIDYWKKIVESPSEAYRELFEREEQYLRKNIKKGDRVLDVGCGDGRNILSIIDVTEFITGIDIDKGAIQGAKANLAQYPDVNFLEGSAFDIPFENEYFDVSVLSMTLVNFDDKKSDALAEMKRVTKKNGKIIISVYSEKALAERIKMYQKIGIPIEKTLNGKVFFSETFSAHTSEQFSLDEIVELMEPLGLEIQDYEEVGDLVYILTLQNRNRSVKE